MANTSRTEAYRLALPVSLQPIFPIEVWSNIFTFTDSHTLWTSLRRVSRPLRREAEREFRTARLHRLHIVWRFVVPSHKFHAPTELHTTVVKRLIDNDNIVEFGLELKADEWSSKEAGASAVSTFETGNAEQVVGLRPLRERVMKALGLQGDSRVGTTQIWFEREGGEYITGQGEVLWKNADLQRKVVEVDWKKMLHSLLVKRCIVEEVSRRRRQDVIVRRWRLRSREQAFDRQQPERLGAY